MPKSRTFSEKQIDRLLAEVDEDNFLSDETGFFGVRRIAIDGFDDGEWVPVETLRAIQNLGAAL